GCARANDEDVGASARAVSLLRLPPDRHASRELVILGVGRGGANRLECGPIGARGEEDVRALEDRARDGLDVLRSFPRAEDHLGKTATKLALRVDSRIGEIVVREAPQGLERAIEGDLAIPDLLEELSKRA